MFLPSNFICFIAKTLRALDSLRGKPIGLPLLFFINVSLKHHPKYHRERSAAREDKITRLEPEASSVNNISDHHRDKYQNRHKINRIVHHQKRIAVKRDKQLVSEDRA